MNVAKRGWERWVVGLGLAIGSWTPSAAVGQGIDLDSEPIGYAAATPSNPVADLDRALEAGKLQLAHDPATGYLRAVLAALHVPESSQMLVFSKTSFQRDRIGPKTPRAVYFNDDVYVGYCQGGDVIEVSVADPELGTVFYALDQKTDEPPRFLRFNDDCLLCHGSSSNQGFPGHLIRSVYADAKGLPILASGSYRTDHASPLDRRWGGWYVTGSTGEQRHMGNLIVANVKRPEDSDLNPGANVSDLGRFFDVSKYLTPHSDVVALMVFEHQAETHNRIARAGLQTRLALYQEEALNRELGKPTGERWQSTDRRIKSAGDDVVEYLLFCEEAPIRERVRGTSNFEREFARRGPRDHQGRSLRDFDLERRLFKHPCSYLIYSKAFAGLPPAVKDYIWRRLFDALTGKDASPAFAHLTPADRQAILEILRETVADLPDYWR